MVRAKLTGWKSAPRIFPCQCKSGGIALGIAGPQGEVDVETEGWDVTYDARGNLIEPHTGVQIGLGTLEVREDLE